TSPARPARPASATGAPRDQVDAQRALATYQALQENLYLPRYHLYQCDSICDSTNHVGTLWPFTSAFAATGYLAALPGVGAPARAAIPDRRQGLAAYYDTGEADPAGRSQPPAYASLAEPPIGPGAPTYYDDNAWVALDELYAYGVTGDPGDLRTAEGLFRFVTSGWDTSSSDPCPGGVFWEDVAGSGRNTVSNAPNAEVGLLLYRATGQASYLDWARKMYDWTRGCLQAPNGMYDDHVNPDGSVNTALWSYNQGTMIGAGALLYQATGDRDYLAQAERTAAASVSYYGGAGGSLDGQPDAFNAIFFRNLFYLASITGNTSYRQMAAAYAQAAWTQDRQPDGLISDPDPTGGEAPVNQTAPMAEIYALLAGSSPMPVTPWGHAPGSRGR
ncbi:MAG: hypothetical protein J2P25_15685, partial [Nocardiopsaceae bacterium]|nr:hypothetical protein [Nocardiopsaceae bacterium]